MKKFDLFISNIYKSDYEQIRRRIKTSDLLITDSTHRIVGIRILKEKKHTAEIIYIGIRSEIPFAKQVALETGKKIITNSNYTLKLIRNHAVGDLIYFFNTTTISQHTNFEKLVRKCDVVITDGNYSCVGLKYSPGKMYAPTIVFLSDDIKDINKITLNFHIPEIIDKPLAREIFNNHNPGENISRLYYRPIAKIYSTLWNNTK